MTKGRMEAFSDGVLAIVITIMVLEMRSPHGADLAALKPLIPTFVCYVLSFVFIGVWWNNHHHLLQAIHHVDGRVLWANLHLLFWLTLVPFATRWMGENHFAPLPVAVYGCVFLFASIAWPILVRALVACHPDNATLSRALGSDRKGKVSTAIYATAIPVSLFAPWVGFAMYVLVALIWLAPDRRIENALKQPARPAV
jgi:TMEM175 potassium channel family protein